MTRLDRREAGSAGDEDDRLVGILAQVERAERALEAQDFAALVFLEQLIAEDTARNVPDVQLEQRVVLRRVGERKAAPASVLEQEVDVLPGEVLQPLVRRKLERNDGDIGRGLVDLFDAAGQLPDLDVAGAANFAHFDHEIGQRLADAQQRKPLRSFRRRISVDGWCAP